MLKLLLVVGLCLGHGISSPELRNGNSGDRHRKTVDSTNTSTVENSLWSLVTTSPANFEIQSRVETDSISGTKPTEIPNMSHGKHDLFNSESVSTGGLSENSANEKKGDGNVRFAKTSDAVYIPLENISASSSALQDYLTTISVDMMPNENSIPDFDRTPDQSNRSSSVSLLVNETSTVLTTTEDKQEYTIRSSPREDKFITTDDPTEGEDKKGRRLENLFSNIENLPILTDKEFPQNLNKKSSHEITITNTDNTSSTSFISGNSESNLLNNTVREVSEDTVSTSTFERNFPEENNSHRGIKLTNAENTTTSSTYFPSENSEGYLFGNTVREVSEDTVSSISPRNFTDLSNAQENNFVPELVTKDKKEINSPHPTISDSSPAYVGEGVENYSVENTKDNSSVYLVNVNEENLFDGNSTNASHPNLDKRSRNTSITPKVSFVSNHDSSIENTSNYIPEKTASPASKEMSNLMYKIILTRNCSEDTLSSQTIQSLTDILNRRLNVQDNAKLVKCVSVYELNFTSEIESRDLFSDVIHTIHEKIGPDMDVKIENYSSIDNDISCSTREDLGHFVIPKLVVYISAGMTLGIIIFMIFVICLRKRYKKNSSSLNLSDMPHVALSVDDYKVAPIPRPSISFPETNRDFLYAYSNETYSRTPDDILKQRNFSNGVGKEAPKLQKGNSTTLEMKSFTRKGDVGRNRSDSKSAPDYEYASAGYWDRMKGRGIGKKQDLDIKW